jgi:hypothetical protein
MLYSEIIAVCSQIHTKHINTLCGQNVEFVNVFSSYRAVNTLRLGYKTSQLMLYSEIIAVCSEIRTKHTNTLCGQNVEFVNVFRSYRAVNTLRLGYKNQSVKAVQ